MVSLDARHRAPVIAASITTNEASDLTAQIRAIKNQVERLMI
jgi:U4/U6 small nuclear ribonucleoprotein SNU13